MEFIIFNQKLLAKNTEEKMNEKNKHYTLRTLLFEDEKGQRDNIAIWDKNLYMLAEENKIYNLHCKKQYSYINVEKIEEVKNK